MDKKRNTKKKWRNSNLVSKSTIMWHTAPERGRTRGQRRRKKLRNQAEANQWWNSWGNKTRIKKLLERLECVTSSIIDRVLNVYKSEASEPYKKAYENIKGEKIFTKEAMKRMREGTRKLEIFRLQGLKIFALRKCTSRNRFSFFLFLFTALNHPITQ